MKLEYVLVNKNKNRSIVKLLSILCGLFIFSSHVYAIYEPAVINASGIEVVPTLQVSQSHDSNYLYASSDEQSDWIRKVSPAVNILKTNGPSEYKLSFGLDVGSYKTHTSDDYLDSMLSLDLHQSFTRKFSLGLMAKRHNLHESRGLGYSSGDLGSTPLSSPDEYHTDSYGMLINYGSKDAIGRIEMNLTGENRQFDTRRDVTSVRDRSLAGGDFTFYYHLLPKTSLIFEVGHHAFTYENNTAYDNTEQHFFSGVSWDITSITTGTLKAGLLKKDFSDAERDDFSGFSWEIGARWTPLSYSVVDALTKGRTEETNSEGDYIDSKSLIVQWTHFWNDRVSTKLNSNLTMNSFKPTGRDEDYLNLSFSVNYDIRRWMQAGLSLSTIENEATDNSYDYQKNIVSINLNLAL